MQNIGAEIELCVDLSRMRSCLQQITCICDMTTYSKISYTKIFISGLSVYFACILLLQNVKLITELHGEVHYQAHAYYTVTCSACISV